MKSILGAGVLMFFVVTLLSFGSSLAATITEVKPGSLFSVSVPDTDLELTGCVAPGGFVTIIDGTSVVGSTTADSVGLYYKKLTSQTPGIHSLKVFFEDTDNVTSSTASDLLALQTKTLNTHELSPSPTISVSPNSVEVGSPVRFFGYACPGSTVEIVIDNNIRVFATADADGYYEVSQSTANFFIGSHTFTVQSNNGGDKTKVSQIYQFYLTLNTGIPNQPIQPRLAPLARSVFGSTNYKPAITGPKDGYVSTGSELVVSGTGPPSTSIEIYVDDELVGSVFIDENGGWTARIFLKNKEQVVKTRSCDSTKCGEFSESVRYFLNDAQIGICEVELLLNKYRFFNIVPGGGIDIQVDAEGFGPNSRLTIDWGDADIDHQAVPDASQNIHHSYSITSTYSGVVTAERSDECYKSAHFTVQVEEPEPLYWLPIILAALFTSTWLIRWTFVKHGHSL